MAELTLSRIAQLVNANLIGENDLPVHGLATLEQASQQEVSFYHNHRYKQQLLESNACAVLLSQKDADLDCKAAKLIVDDPYYAFSVLAEQFAYKNKRSKGIHLSAVIGEACDIHSSVSIGPNVVIGDGVKIGANTRIAANAVIEDFAQLGESVEVYPQVTVCHHVHIGDRVILHPACVIGSDGFGNAMHQGQWHKVPQLGSVIIGNDVEIGANTTIDRGALGNTEIADGARLDNLIQIGHNVKIGKHTAIAATTAIAGSVTIGNYCMIGGAAKISGHLSIVDQVILTGGAEVSKSIEEPGLYSSGTALMTNRDWRKNIARLRHLDEYIRLLKKLAKQRG